MWDHAETVESIWGEARSGNYDKAVVLLSDLEKAYGLPPNLLVMKGCWIQLSSDASDFTLEDAEESFLAAIQIDDTYVDAYLELGWFYFSVMDDAARAKPMFEKAVSVCSDQSAEAVKGIASCLAETQGKPNALQYLDHVRDQFWSTDALDAIREEVEQAP